MKKYKIVTSGVSSEYVLEGLSKYLRNEGYEVNELDFGYFSTDPKLLLSELSRQKTIYITSAHTNLTRSLANFLVPNFSKYYPNYLAPIEIIPILKPELSIYIPHDLLTPYGESNLSEIRFLDLFEHILVPTLLDKKIFSSLFSTTPKIHYAGWIKNVENKSIPGKKIKVVLFISIINHLQEKYGTEKLIEYLKPLLQKGTAIKFPMWKNIEEIEEKIKKCTEAEVIPSTVSSIDLIRQGEIIVCNHASSIHAEATLLGKPTIFLLDDEGVSSKEQLEKLQHLPNLYFHDYRKKKPIPVSLINKLRNLKTDSLLKPFDYKMVTQIIENGDIHDD